MNYRGLKLFKFLTYIFLIYSSVGLVAHIAIGFLTVNDSFIGCYSGSCSYLNHSETTFDFSDIVSSRFQKPEYEYEEINMTDGTTRTIRKPKLESNKMQLVSFPVNIAMFLSWLFQSAICIYILFLVKMLDNESVFDAKTQSMLSSVLLYIVLLFVFNEIISIIIDINTLGSFNFSFDFGMTLFVILIIFFIRDIIKEGTVLKTESQLTI